jgi:predicted transcriptional regulator
MNFADQLKSEQDRLGLTQAEVAALLEVSPRAVWKWLHGDEPELAVTREGVIARLKKAKAKK